MYYPSVAEGRQAMKLLYKAKWCVVVLTAIMLWLAFSVLYAGGTASLNRMLLGANLLLLVAQTTNVFISFKNKQKDTWSVLLAFFLLSIALMCLIYVCSWNYVVKAVTIGFE